MKAVVQRVSEARVEVEGRVVGTIGCGLMVLLCAMRGDRTEEADRLLAKLLKLRIFADDSGRMNRSVQDVDGLGRAGGLLIVSQFTLAADTAGGNRPSFGAAAAPDEGRRLYEHLLQCARERHPVVAAGEFGAHMHVHLVNDGPVTIALEVAPPPQS